MQLSRKYKTKANTKTRKPAKASKVATAPKAPEAKTPTPPKSAFAPDAKIALLVKENPHRVGTILHTYYAKYKDGMTVRQALEAGIIPVNLRYLTQRKIIRIGG